MTDVYCFSGTGNSLFVATRIADALNGRVCMITDCRGADVTSADDVVWVFPVYSWGIAPVMRRFMETVDVGGKRHHMVCTCGDDIGLTHWQWRRIMASRGQKACGAYSVGMPNTYVLLPGFDVDSPEVERQKLSASCGRIDEVAQKIASGFCGDDVVEGRMPWIKSKVIYPLFARFGMSPKPFHPTVHCTGCGTCAAACPLNNIKMRNHRPLWGNDCAMCLRCYHICPAHAVAYGKATRDKGQYMLKPKK